MCRMQLRSVLAENLIRLRGERGWSQETFAEKAGIDRTYASALERKRYAASVDVLERIAEALDVDASELLRINSTDIQ